MELDTLKEQFLRSTKLFSKSRMPEVKLAAVYKEREQELVDLASSYRAARIVSRVLSLSMGGCLYFAGVGVAEYVKTQNVWDAPVPSGVLFSLLAAIYSSVNSENQKIQSRVEAETVVHDALVRRSAASNASQMNTDPSI